MTDVFQAPQGPKAVHGKPVSTKEAMLVNDELLTDFNKAVQDSLEGERTRLNNLHAIIRCDNLPHVLVKANDLRRLSDCLINLMLQHPPKRSKLFIYLKCNRIDDSVLTTPQTNGLETYEICFHTNSCNEASWHDSHKVDLAECASLCTQYSGAFTYAHGHADGLFKLTLPGKLF
jgi:hypothetical protein